MRRGNFCLQMEKLTVEAFAALRCLRSAAALPFLSIPAAQTATPVGLPEILIAKSGEGFCVGPRRLIEAAPVEKVLPRS